jgi:hypothetical protein
MIGSQQESKMGSDIKPNDSWVSSTKHLEIPVCVILKKHQNKQGRWEYQEVSSWRGDWNDIIFELYETYGQFKNEVDHLSKKDRHEKLDKLATIYEVKDEPYEFMLTDFTDDWYVAYCKSITFRVGPRGEVT